MDTIEQTENQAPSADTQISSAHEFIEKLLKAMQMDVTVELVRGVKSSDPEEGEEVRFEISGPDSARIIGKRGSVLEAIQYLTTRVVQRTGGERKHFVVDAESYRARHEEQLSAMASKLAARVAAEGKVITFDPMNARERRVVHMAVRAVPGVKTESHGEGLDRRVQIMPENHPGGAAVPPASGGGDRGRSRGGRGGRGGGGGGRGGGGGGGGDREPRRTPPTE